MKHTLFLILFCLCVGAPTSQVFGIEKASIKPITLTIHDKVRRLIEVPQGYKVLFQLHAAVYHLQKDLKDYESVLKTLKSSEENGETIYLKVDANTLAIEGLAP